MPLVYSPIFSAAMRRIHCFDIGYDVCPVTGGVTLDTGELETLIARLKREPTGEDLLTSDAGKCSHVYLAY